MTGEPNAPLRASCSAPDKRLNPHAMSHPRQREQGMAACPALLPEAGKTNSMRVTPVDRTQGYAVVWYAQCMSTLTKQGGGVAEVEVQGDAALLRGEGALPLQVRLPSVVARKAQRLGHHIPLAVPAHLLTLSSYLRSHSFTRMTETQCLGPRLCSWKTPGPVVA